MFESWCYMKEIGEKLKEARENMGITIDEVATDLNVPKKQVENLEEGNMESFKDVFYLKYFIRDYAKYLGLDSDKVVDEFNGFLFQHTSKISLDDIMEAQKRKEATEKKIKSPYTKEYKEKVNIWPYVLTVLGVLCFILLVYFIVTHIHRTPKRVNELRSYQGGEIVYEFTN